jgi:hypothetical protein
MSMIETLADRDVRQRDLVPRGRLDQCHAVVIGVGAIGRQVALQLAAIGISSLELIDHDIVAVENLAPQGYWPEDLTAPKVHATAKQCRSIHPAIQITATAQRYRRSYGKVLAEAMATARQLAVFCCVDSIATRGSVWESLKNIAWFFADGRMSAEVIRVLVCADPATDVYYQGTLFDPANAYAGACTSRSTIYTASIAAGLMLGQFTKWLRELPLDRDLMLNLLSAELIAS